MIPICRSQIYHLFFRHFQKQNLHSAFWRRSAQRGPIRVIISTTQRQDVMISGGLSRLNDRITAPHQHTSWNFPAFRSVATQTRLCCSSALSLSHDGTRHQTFLVPVPFSFEAACSQARPAPEVTLRGTMCPLRSLALKPHELTAQPMPFNLGKHFVVAILLRVHQGHHGHTAQCRPGGG